MIRIGTRGSRLALWQAHYTQDLLKQVGLESEIIIIKTQGDNVQHLGFDKLEGKGFFTKEIEDELLAGNVDMAVHSMKDMPTTQPEGLVLGAVSYREDARDILLIRNDKVDTSAPLRLQSGAVVGTSSVRRKAQIMDLNPNVTTKDIRGNVPRRIDKLREGQFDAIVLAAAGLARLDLDVSDLTAMHLHPKEFVPAPAQGVLAYQCRLDDMPTRKMLAQHLHDALVSQVIKVERTVLQMMDGGCHVPLGVYCQRDKNGNYRVEAAFQADGEDRLRRVSLSQSTTVTLADKVYNALLSFTTT
jgi:hydroxymethylbilane synthase